MVKKSLYIFFLFFALCTNAFAQKDSAKGYVHTGLLRATLTYSVGYMTALTDVNNIYITGNMEYYADNKISARGDIYFFVNSMSNNGFLKMNHQLYFGGCYNFPVHSHFVPFIGLQPGIAYSQVNYGSHPGIFDPLASGVAGINYFAEKWFNITVNVRYTMGNYIDESGLFSLNEISFSFGLGWDIDVVKHK